MTWGIKCARTRANDTSRQTENMPPIVLRITFSIYIDRASVSKARRNDSELGGRLNGGGGGGGGGARGSSSSSSSSQRFYLTAVQARKGGTAPAAHDMHDTHPPSPCSSS